MSWVLSVDMNTECNQVIMDTECMPELLKWVRHYEYCVGDLDSIGVFIPKRGSTYIHSVNAFAETNDGYYTSFR